MEQIATALALYSKGKPKTPENIIGLKIFPLSDGHPDYTQIGMIIWKTNLDALMFGGIRAPVYQSLPLVKQ